MDTTGRPDVAEKLMTTRDVEAYTNGVVKAATLRWWRHAGGRQGPKSFRLGARRVVYRKSDVDAWLDAEYASATA